LSCLFLAEVCGWLPAVLDRLNLASIYPSNKGGRDRHLAHFFSRTVCKCRRDI